jgi:hypothetical protein
LNPEFLIPDPRLFRFFPLSGHLVSLLCREALVGLKCPLTTLEQEARGKKAASQLGKDLVGGIDTTEILV